MICIKKYKNRKYYDTTNKRYVNLSQIAEILKTHQIKVIEQGSERDITFYTILNALSQTNFKIDELKKMIIEFS